ncbi:MAG: DUF2203 domain-containing protein [Methanobacteriota archaeon]
MSEPAELDVHPSVPPRLFTAEEANALLPVVETVLIRMDPKLVRLRELEELLEDHEAYWGASLQEPGAPERDAYLGLVAEVADVRAGLEADAAAIREAGAELKDVHLGLVDFHATIDGQIAYLCWRRGEPRVGHWHTLQSGYAGRTPLPDAPRSQP